MSFEIENQTLIEYHGTAPHVVIPSGVTEIEEDAFYECLTLESVVIPDGVEVIGIGAFSDCANLRQVTLPDSLTEINDMAFYNCSSLRSVTLPDSMTFIDRRVFYGCESLRSVFIPDSVTEIKRFAFTKCTALTSLAIPDNVTEIEEFAFQDCPGITIICSEGSCAHQYCSEYALPYIFDYQFEAFHGLLPQGYEKLASPFLADEEKPYIFISYSHKDRDAVLPIIKVLYEAGWKIWYDEGLTIGDSYDETLETHVKNCAAFLLFVSNNSIASMYCTENEIPWALDSGRPVIKCILDEGSDIAIPEGSLVAAVSVPDIGPALERVDGLVRGERREAKGISVVFNPADREAPGSGSFAYCLYTGSGAAAAKAILLEAKNNGCSLYDGVENADTDEKRAESACLIIFLDKAFLAEERLTEILIEAYLEGRDIAVCQLEEIEDADLPQELTGLHKMQWLNYVYGISADMNTKLARHLQKRGCRDRAVLPGFDYENKNGGIVIKRYTGSDPEPRIESEYGGIPVTEIAGRAFLNCVRLKTLVIPEEIKKIGDSAFEGCTDLTSINIPDGVTKIETSTFAHCRSLPAIRIPDTVTQIGYGAFEGCVSLALIDIPDGVTSLGTNAFSDCASLRSVTIPDSVKTFCDSLFAGCKSLPSIIVPRRCIRIVPRMFHGCAGLTSVTIPDHVYEIGRDAFAECTNLTSVTIPGRVSLIGPCAFENCESLTEVEISEGVAGIGYDAFAGCRSLTSIYIPATVTEIGTGVFRDCEALTVICSPGTRMWEYCEENSIPHERF